MQFAFDTAPRPDRLGVSGVPTLLVDTGLVLFRVFGSAVARRTEALLREDSLL